MIKLKPKIIMMSGFTACGKTTNARKISISLKSNNEENIILQSDSIRRELLHDCSTPEYFNDNNAQTRKKRDEVYSRIVELAEKEIKNGKTIILDAGYNKRYTREGVYRLADRLKCELYVINVLCEDDNEVKKRIQGRKGVTSCEQANKLEIYRYSKELSDPIIEDMLPNGSTPKIIFFDTPSGKVKCFTFEDEFSILLKNTLENGYNLPGAS